ncbi:MAG: rhodanese-like domain-containing protein [Halobacteriaceae archaeon]
MRRRAFLAAGTAGLAGLAGCLSGGDGSDQTHPQDEHPDDGMPPPGTVADPPSVHADLAAFETIERDGETIRLAPADVVFAWYANRAVRVLDARGTTQYEASHVFGAVSSPAAMLAGAGGPDPVADWPRGDRVVAYCGCPHHISSRRAATLQRNGYEDVFVLDEGFWDGWHDLGRPMAGTEVSGAPRERVVAGRVDPASAGATAVLVHPQTGQREEAPVGADGRFRLHLHFYGVDDDSVVRLRTPDYAVRARLGDLTDGVVTARATGG